MTHDRDCPSCHRITALTLEIERLSGLGIRAARRARNHWPWSARSRMYLNQAKDFERRAAELARELEAARMAHLATGVGEIVGQFLGAILQSSGLPPPKAHHRFGVIQGGGEGGAGQTRPRPVDDPPGGDSA